MTADPRAALATLVAALERHLELAASRRDADDPAVAAAAEAVIEAFDDYDETLFDTTGVATPLGVYVEDDDEDDDDEEDDEDDDEDEEEDDDSEDDDEDEDDEGPADPRELEDTSARVYAGLDDEDIDFDEDADDEDADDDADDEDANDDEDDEEPEDDE